MGNAGCGEGMCLRYSATKTVLEHEGRLEPIVPMIEYLQLPWELKDRDMLKPLEDVSRDLPQQFDNLLLKD